LSPTKWAIAAFQTAVEEERRFSYMRGDFRHREKRSDAAIHLDWFALLAMAG
jgi:hypothetical protein